MWTTVTERGQTAIPAKLRERFQIRAGDRLEWLDDGQIIRVVPISGDPVALLRGCAKGEDLRRKLLAERGRDG